MTPVSSCQVWRVVTSQSGKCSQILLLWQLYADIKKKKRLLVSSWVSAEMELRGRTYIIHLYTAHVCAYIYIYKTQYVFYVM